MIHSLQRFVLLVGLVVAGPVSGMEWVVAPDGSDANPGSRAEPFATLERARDAIREARTRESEFQGATVYLRGGVYPMQRVFSLSREDSGTPDAPILYTASPGERPVFFGGTSIPRDAFVPVTDATILDRIICEAAREQVLQCDLHSLGITNYGPLSRRGFYRHNLGRTPPAELYINGERMMRARWPNPDDHFPEYLRGVQQKRRGVVGRSRIVDPGPGRDDDDFLERGGVIGYAFDRPTYWTQAQDIWLDGIFTASWEWSFNHVAHIDPDKQEITLRYGEVSTIEDRYSFDYFFAENLLEEIDLPGEYFLDTASGILYLWPPPNFDEEVDIILATWTGPMFALNAVSHVWFRDLTFDMGRGGAIAAVGGEGVLVEHCDFSNLSGTAISLDGRNHGVRGSRLRHIGGKGIRLSGGDLDSLEPGGLFVEDSEIKDFSWYDRVYQSAISLAPGSVGNRITRNRIRHGPHLAIVVYGNDHLIEYNDIGHVVEEFTDMGAIYANLGARPLERGIVVRRNYIHHIGLHHHLQNGVYPDNMSMGWRIEENIFHRIGGEGEAANSRSVNLNTAAHVLVRNNIFVDCTMPVIMSGHSGNHHYERHLAAWKELFAERDLSAMPHAERYPELLDFFDEPRQFPESNVFAQNVVYNPETSLMLFLGRHRLPMQDGALDETGTLQIRDNWVTDADPGFVDGPHGDFNLRPDAPVFDRIPGFPVIPFDEIGPRIAPGVRRD